MLLLESANKTYHVVLAHRQQRDRLQQFSWRPRPPSLLSPEQEREITRNLKKYSRRYEEEDATLGQEEDVKLKEERERLMAEWTEWVDSKRAFVEQREAGMRALLGSRYDVRCEGNEVGFDQRALPTGGGVHDQRGGDQQCGGGQGGAVQGRAINHCCLGVAWV